MDAVLPCDARILDLIPDGVLALDRAFTILRLNRAACSLLGLQDAALVIGRPVGCLMDEKAFSRLGEGECEHRDTISLDVGVMEREIFCDEEHSLFVCVLRKASRQWNGLPSEQERACELADALIEKQLAIVHEIAGLLGEAAVETQSAVQELKAAVCPAGEKRYGRE